MLRYLKVFQALRGLVVWGMGWGWWRVEGHTSYSATTPSQASPMLRRLKRRRIWGFRVGGREERRKRLLRIMKMRRGGSRIGGRAIGVGLFNKQPPASYTHLHPRCDNLSGMLQGMGWRRACERSVSPWVQPWGNVKERHFGLAIPSKI
jgi:hypothetical protein